MSIISAYLPSVDAHRMTASVQSLALTSINEHVDRMRPATDGERDRLIRQRLRNRQRFMADAFCQSIISGVLRSGPQEPQAPVTGGSRSAPGIMVNVVRTERALLDSCSSEVAELAGYQRVPAEQIAAIVAENPGRVWLRRLFTHPTTGQLVQMDARTRRFTGAMAEFIRLRAHACQKPFCNGTLPHTGVSDHIDHVRPHSRGGPTSLANGAALDAFCNLSKADRDIAEPLPDGTGIRWRTRSGREIITNHRRFRT